MPCMCTIVPRNQPTPRLRRRETTTPVSYLASADEADAVYGRAYGRYNQVLGPEVWRCVMHVEINPSNAPSRVPGLVAFMIIGAVIGMFLPLPVKSEGAVALVVVGALLGAIICLRIKQHAGETCVICMSVIFLGWPLICVVLDVLHRYY